MKTRALAVMIAAIALLQPSTAAAQDALAQARTLYASADYEQALKLLEAAPAGLDSHYYRALCLIALGRNDAAANQIAAVLAVDPMFVPPPGEVSPRVAATFTDTRRRLLPGIARATFTDARASFQAGDHEAARKQFELTLKLLGDSAIDEDDDLADLRLVASGFLDLAKLEAAAEPEPAAAAPGAQEPAAGPTASASDAAAPVLQPGGQATPPVTLSQELPPWRPASSEARFVFTGAVHVDIDAAGRVTAVSIVRSVHPEYDPLILSAAQRWRYRPATLNGSPVASEKTVEIQLRP